MGEGFGCTPKFFADPAPNSSDKENDPPNDTQMVMTFKNLNLSDNDRLQEEVSLPECPPNFIGPIAQLVYLNGLDAFV